MPEKEIKKTVNIKINSVVIEGELTVPENSSGLVLFAHGSGSSRFSPRNNFVAQILQKEKLATLLVDLLTKQEDLIYESRFDINLLSERLIGITKWLKETEETKDLSIGYFGASTGAASAVISAAKEKANVSAIVSRGGRVDLADKQLAEIETPILLIVGENDDFVIDVNQYALKKINCTKELSIIPKATHLFEEPGALEEVAKQAANWFLKFLKKE
ncbi:MAG: alpha/beta family hydrolase [bacterium]